MEAAGPMMMRLERSLPGGEAILQVEEAISMLDDKLKRYYNTARETVPDLVTTETEPRKFLQVSNGDIHKAAETIAFYWMNRHRCFGERWLLPMTQTGSGCLSREDIEGLRSGYLVVLTLPDSRQILVSDPSRINKQRFGGGLLERLAFYYATAVLNDTTRVDGIDLIFIASSCGLVNNNDEYAERLQRVYQSLPFKLKGISTVPTVEEGKELLQEYFAFLVQKTNEATSPMALKNETARTPELALCNLAKKGIDRIFLPKRIGGLFDYDVDFSDWIRMRLSVEGAMSAALPLRNLFPTGALQKPDRTDKGLSDILRRSHQDEINPVAQEDFVRERNAMYARRRTQKIKIQQLTLRDQKESIEAENERLRKDNDHIELLLARACVLVTLGDVNANAGLVGW